MKVIYLVISFLRLLNRKLLNFISTAYYQRACASFGQNSVVSWGTWIRYPDRVAIGDRVFIDKNVEIGTEFRNASLKIFSDVKINRNVLIDYSGDLEIGSNTLISEQAIVYSHSHGLDPHSDAKPIPKKIGSKCWIGVRSIILENCSSIANGSIVGANSTVTKDICDAGIYAGSPARLLRIVPSDLSTS